jgi:hypothetical protein
LDAAEAAVHGFAELQLELRRGLIEVSAGRRVGAVQVGVR